MAAMETQPAAEQDVDYLMGERDPERNYIYFQTEAVEYSKCQSVAEETSLVGAYLTVLSTIALSVYTAILGTQHRQFTMFLFLAVFSCLVMAALLYVYNKYLPSRKENNASSQQIICDGETNRFVIINSVDTIACSCFHLESVGETLFECQLTAVQNVECLLDEQNEMKFVIYYLDAQTQSNETIVFNSDYFFCNKEWHRKIDYALSVARNWSI
mmetsp:Transcript_42803/g.68701  ORF Transcript_42803/g.68701 Transcript_42803/m.68701 type:complete len:214 (+) Transcript_42803:47-688(+)